jgi:acyl dehydratase
MTSPLHFESLNVGDRWQSQGRTVTETDVVNFAGLTGDYDPLHVDHEFARQTPFGRPLAHGLLGLSLVAGLASQCPRVSTLALLAIQSWEFLKPVFIGDTLHVVTQVLEKRPHGNRSGRVTWQKQLVNQDAQVVQSGVFETLVASAAPHRRQDGPEPTKAPSDAKSQERHIAP